MKRIYTTLISLLFSTTVSAQTLFFESGDHRTQLVELFTSQGCSSCPPAERWLNKFKHSDDLWRRVVPIAFHVDYWDRLGWPDPYASRDYSYRQRSYHHQGNVGSVYTPGFVVDGREWRGFFGSKVLPDPQLGRFKLKAAVRGNQAALAYEWHGQEIERPLEFNVAVLGVGIQTQVARGENARRTLKQDFVALQHLQRHSQLKSETFSLGKYARPEVERYAVAAWVADPESGQVIQSVGGWITD